MLGLVLGFGSLVVLGCVGGMAGYYWERLSRESGVDLPRGGFLGWLIRGLAVPLVLLFFFNTGWFSGIPPVAVGGGEIEPGTARWVILLPDRLAGATSVTASWWGVVTLAWLLALLVGAVRGRKGFRARWVLGLCLTVPLAGWVTASGGFGFLGFALMVPLGGVMHALLPLGEVHTKQPLYASAVGHIKMGRYAEAEASVLSELEACPDDYQGWMLLAELYAEHFGDLSLAEQTVGDLCDQPGLSGIQISLALHRLADWHLKLDEDPQGARRALRGIMERLAGSHFARMAAQREARLPLSRADLQDRKRVRSIPLPALSDPLDARVEAHPGSATERAAAVERANLLTARLKHDPNDPEPREELARLLVDSLGCVEEGMEQVRLLLGLPERPEERVPEWLAMLAAWQLRHGGGREEARVCLETLVRDYPQAPQSMVARRRLNLMDLARKSPLRT